MTTDGGRRSSFDVPKMRIMEAAARFAPALLVLIVLATIVAVVFVRRAPAAASIAEPHVSAHLLQSALLPADPPVVDGLRVSWSYAFGNSPNSGGDFYDAFFLDDGTLAVMIGDASGHGVSAAIATNTVRQALRGALIDGARPADALRRANRVLLRSNDAGYVTALVGIIDPATLQFRYAGAGHPSPLLATADDICTALPGTGAGIALGVVPHHVTSEFIVAIPVDGVLALYTDGCVKFDRDGSAGAELLGEALVDVRKLAPRKPAVTIDSAIFRLRRHDDDATIVTITPEPQLANLHVRLPAEPASAPLARTALRRFLASTALGERRAFDAVVATGEAVANAIEHAYDRRPNQTFVLRARCEANRCTILVEDTGGWHDSVPANARGRGIAMMRELSDVFEIERSTSGTAVILAFLTSANVADGSLVVAT
jgi:anti-sigma regulatory factor (Ser/Thr protein kinase)